MQERHIAVIFINLPLRNQRVLLLMSVSLHPTNHDKQMTLTVTKRLPCSTRHCVQTGDLVEPKTEAVVKFQGTSTGGQSSVTFLNLFPSPTM